MKHDENINVSPHRRLLMMQTNGRRTRAARSSVIQKNNEFVNEKNDFDDSFGFFLKHFDDASQSSSAFHVVTNSEPQQKQKNIDMNVQSDTTTKNDFENIT